MMPYDKIVFSWNDSEDEPWDSLTEKQKIIYAYNEGVTDGYLHVSDIASRLSERESINEGSEHNRAE